MEEKNENPEEFEVLNHEQNQIQNHVNNQTQNHVNNQTQNKKWFALYTKPRHEFKAQAELSENNIEHYLPTYIKINQWSDRKKKITEPLLRGYIFVYVNEKERLTSLTAKSIVKCLSFNGKPAEIPAWQIENLRTMLQNKGEFLVSDLIKVGQKVKIIDGPFTGVTGLVTKSPSGNSLSVSIDLLNRSVTVTLPQESITKEVSEEKENNEEQ